MCAMAKKHVFDSETMIAGRTGKLMLCALAFLFFVFLVEVKFTSSVLSLSWHISG
jgi:hypothetical protein